MVEGLGSVGLTAVAVDLEGVSVEEDVAFGGGWHPLEEVVGGGGGSEGGLDEGD